MDIQPLEVSVYRPRQRKAIRKYKGCAGAIKALRRLPPLALHEWRVSIDDQPPVAADTFMLLRGYRLWHFRNPEPKSPWDGFRYAGRREYEWIRPTPHERGFCAELYGGAVINPRRWTEVRE